MATTPDVRSVTGTGTGTGLSLVLLFPS